MAEAFPGVLLAAARALDDTVQAEVVEYHDPHAEASLDEVVKLLVGVRCCEGRRKARSKGDLAEDGRAILV
jgi:hypothetical protein